jgi:hypothetical protein
MDNRCKDAKRRATAWLRTTQREHFKRYIEPHRAATMSHFDPTSPSYARMSADPFGWADTYIQRFVVEPLLNSLSPLQRAMTKAIPVGTLLTSDPNACAIQPNDFSSGAVIVIDWMLFSFIGQAIRPILRMLDGLPVAERMTMANRLVDCMEYFTSGGRRGKLELYQYDNSLEAMSQCLERGALTFVLGHEYAHVLLGHLNPDDISRTELGLLKYNKNWQQEFEADKHGAEIVSTLLMELERQICEKSVSNLPCASPLVLMSLIRLLEKFLGAEDGSWSHPPASQRREHLSPYFHPMLLKHASYVGKWFEHIANLPWHEVGRD